MTNQTTNPDPASDRPLVTFALFAYNQERYIREAVEGAFSQTYEPLEIILSDDCSSDQTFEIMQEMAAAYRGKHSIRVRQNQNNLGVVNHLYSVAVEARSEYIIVAAGDDISKPERSAMLVRHVLEYSSDAACSNVDFVLENGEIIETNALPTHDYIKKYTRSHVGEILVAPAAIYRKELIFCALESVKRSRSLFKLHQEDFLIWLYLAGTGRRLTRISDCSLVKYRINSNSISNVKARSSTLTGELGWLRKEATMFKINYEKQCAALEMTDNIDESQSRLDRCAIQRGLNNARIKVMQSSPNVITRFKALGHCRTCSDIRTALLRLPGQNVAAALRWALR